MTELSYGVLLDRLFPRLRGGIRWGLGRTRRLLVSVGDPHFAYPVLHVGGTNGKGSVAAIAESVLRHHGLSTGLYTSPHLIDFRERIQIGGRPIGEAELLAAARTIWPAIEAEAPTFFEATTAIAFLAMRRAAVDIAVVEVGMGGRLDSTNVVAPEVTVITNVALDHAQYLGSDLESIAAEKAGIIKSGVPVVTGETDPAVLAVLEAAAAERGSPFHRVEPPLAESDLRGTTAVVATEGGDLSLRVPLPGRHQATNVAVAVRAVELLRGEQRPSRAALIEGVGNVRWPGRLQVAEHEGVCWVFDLAHNAAGVSSLVTALTELPLRRPVVALMGVLGDKDWNAMLPPLFEVVDRAILVEPPSAPAERRWNPDAVLAQLGRRIPAEVVRPFAAGLAEAIRAAEGGTVLCTGSAHTVGDALDALGIAPFPDGAGLPPGAAGS